jgi:hypothetical protein
VIRNGGGAWAKFCQNNRTRPSHVHFVHPNVTRKARDVPHTPLCDASSGLRFRMDSVTWKAASHESLTGTGTPSELVHVNDFLRGAHDSAALVSYHPQNVAEDEDPAQQDSIVTECRWVPRTDGRITR